MVEASKPGFQRRPGETGLSVFDKRIIGAEELLPLFRPGSQVVERTIAQIRARGMDVIRTPGDPTRLSPQACQAHCEIVPGAGMTRNQFKKALRELE